MNANIKLFNPMPSLTLTATQAIVNELKFDGSSLTDTKDLKKVKKIFKLLIEEVLMKIKHKDRNKRQLRYLLEDIDDDLNEEIQRKSQLSEAAKNYIRILKKCDRKIVNAAKEALRDAIFNSMNHDWIFNFAINKHFRREKKLNQIVLEKYLKNFRRELKNEGKVSFNVDRNYVLKIYSYIQEE